MKFTSLFHDENDDKTFLSSIKCSYKLINYNNNKNSGDIKIIVKINEGFSSKDSVGCDISLNNLYISWGPYFSCHSLSFFWNIFIVGVKNFVGSEDKKFINQRERGICPIKIYNFVLKGVIIPSKIPLIKIVGINSFINVGIKKVWVGKINHIIVVPIIIEYGTIIINGISIIFLFENMISDFIFKVNFMVNFIIRKEYVAVIPMEISIITLRNDKSLELIIYSKIESFEKNPDIKGIPKSVILEIIITVDKRGVILVITPMWRMSW